MATIIRSSINWVLVAQRLTKKMKNGVFYGPEYTSKIARGRVHCPHVQVVVHNILKKFGIDPMRQWPDCKYNLLNVKRRKKKKRNFVESENSDNNINDSNISNSQ